MQTSNESLSPHSWLKSKRHGTTDVLSHGPSSGLRSIGEQASQFVSLSRAEVPYIPSLLSLLTLIYVRPTFFLFWHSVRPSGPPPRSNFTLSPSFQKKISHTRSFLQCNIHFLSIRIMSLHPDTYPVQILKNKWPKIQKTNTFSALLTTTLADIYSRWPTKIMTNLTLVIFT